MRKKLAAVIVLFVSTTLASIFFFSSSGNHAYNYEPSGEQYEFVWSSPESEYLARMKEEYKLEQLVADVDDDFVRVKLISSWVSGLWDHHGSNTPEKNDPISIVSEAEEGERFRCVEYSIVVNGALNSLGIPARTVSLKTKNVQWTLWGAGHVVVEAYLEDLGKWIMIDGQWDVIPVLNGTPLSAIELQQALASEYTSGLGVASLTEANADEYFKWIEKYLYYFDVALDKRVGVEREPGRLMLTPIGAMEPKRFQIFFPLDNMTYTSSIDDFYPTF